MKYARMKVQIIRNNSNATSTTTMPATTASNNNSNKPQDELNPQLADPTVVAKVSSFYERDIRFLFKLI